MFGVMPAAAPAAIAALPMAAGGINVNDAVARFIKAAWKSDLIDYLLSIGYNADVLKAAKRDALEQAIRDSATEDRARDMLARLPYLAAAHVKAEAEGAARRSKKGIPTAGAIAMGLAAPAAVPGSGKRVASAYIIFSQAYRPQVKAANPSATFAQISAATGAAWKAMTDAQKAPFIAEHERLKAAAGK